MYYEEKIVNGFLMCRTSPNGVWHPCSIEKVCTRLSEAKELIKNINASRQLVSKGFMTTQSNGEDYKVVIEFDNIHDAHALHRALIELSK